jgi:excinuclease ABC subunit B
MLNKFKLESKFLPSGDQPQAIQSLVDGLNDGLKNQVLLGITGSGKTFTIANIIEKVNRPSLVIAHNKILAAQLCNELREFFPNNRVEFFVSYYDYYQPEAYISSTDTYIEKDMAINDEVDKLRNSATSSLLERNDVIIVASVSCIFGLGSPEEYYNLQISLRQGQTIERNDVIRKLLDIQYKRNDIDFARSTFRAKGDILDIFPANSSSTAIRVEFFGDEIEKISEFDSLTGTTISTLSHISIYPATHYAVGSERLKKALKQIANDLDDVEGEFVKENQLIEAQRIRQRVNYDLEMMTELGYCNGIENYSRYFDGRQQGDPPFTLLDYFPKDFVTIIDESHMTLPQIRAMYNGDKARKKSLVEYGFRLPSAYDNRPLNFEEFNKRIGQVVYVSATPALYEREIADNIAEQVLRPTGLLDPEIEILPTENQIDALQNQLDKTISLGGRILITTLTKRMAESLSIFLGENGFKVKYMHSEIDTLERIEIINGLRRGDFDVLVGINLLREGLDMPEVELVCILDADKEGFLRSESALLQTIGRASRNKNGRVVLFADRITKSMQKAIDITQERRKIQQEYNEKHGITPKTIIKEVKNTLEITKKEGEDISIEIENIPVEIEKLKAMMAIASSQLDFETAISLRNRIGELNTILKKTRR